MARAVADDLAVAAPGVREAGGAAVPGSARGEQRPSGASTAAELRADADGPRIQLLAPISPDSAIAKFIDRSGPGLQQLAYTVADVEQTSAALRERGLRLLYDTPRRGTGGSLINFVHPKDAGGVLVELVQPA